jgi:hypothetical protein
MKQNYSILIFLIFLFSLSGRAQRITNVQATVKDDKVLIGYQVKGLECQQSIESINFYVSKDGGNKFIGPLNEISGDINPGLRNGKYIVAWEALKEMPFSDERLIFDVRADIDEKKRQRAIMLSYVGNTTTPLGGRIGQLGKVSWYLEGRASTLVNQATMYSYSGNTLEGYGQENTEAEPTDEDGWKAFSAIIGTTIQTDCNFFIYIGMGYSSEKYIKKFDETESGQLVGTVWAIDDSETMQGLEMDGGLIFRYKKLIISGGLTILNLERYNWSMGLGIAL